LIDSSAVSIRSPLEFWSLLGENLQLSAPLEEWSASITVHGEKLCLGHDATAVRAFLMVLPALACVHVERPGFRCVESDALQFMPLAQFNVEARTLMRDKDWNEECTVLLSTTQNVLLGFDRRRHMVGLAEADSSLSVSALNPMQHLCSLCGKVAALKYPNDMANYIDHLGRPHDDKQAAERLLARTRALFIENMFLDASGLDAIALLRRTEQDKQQFLAFVRPHVWTNVMVVRELPVHYVPYWLDFLYKRKYLLPNHIAWQEIDLLVEFVMRGCMPIQSFRR
jgi:hypothetical protein